MEELVDVAVRALSPAVNVPFLAALCVNNLTVALGRILDGEDTENGQARLHRSGAPGDGRTALS
jgi:uncharacterized membrane protein